MLPSVIKGGLGEECAGGTGQRTTGSYAALLSVNRKLCIVGLIVIRERMGFVDIILIDFAISPSSTANFNIQLIDVA
jgi:hypothetical protein